MILVLKCSYFLILLKSSSDGVKIQRIQYIIYLSFNNILNFMFLFFNSIHMSATPAVIHDSSSHIIERKIFGLNFFFLLLFNSISYIYFPSLSFKPRKISLPRHKNSRNLHGPPPLNFRTI